MNNLKIKILALLLVCAGGLSYADTSNTRLNVTTPTVSIDDDYENSSYTNQFAAIGGAINNSSTIENVTGSFTNNFVTTTGSSYAQGGAIYNFTSAKIDSIAGDFAGNYASATGTSNVVGGAIMNRAGTITDISGSFTGNYVKGSYYSNKTIDGGAIANLGDSSAGVNAYVGLLASEKDLLVSKNYSSIKTSGVTKYASSGIRNYSTGTNANAVLGLKALNGNKIIINDAITGATYTDNQIIEVNNVSLDDTLTSYSIVEINNSVSNQTINVHNGTLKLGNYVGNEYVNDNYTTSASVANLTNVKLNVGLSDESSSQLSVIAGETVDLVASTITFGANSELSIDISALDSYVIDDLSLISCDAASSLIHENLEKINLVDGNNQILSSASDDAKLIYSNYEWRLSFENNGLTLITVVVPEPSTYAMIFGGLALGVAFYRKRRQ